MMIALYALVGAAIGVAVSLVAFALLRPRTTAEALLYAIASATVVGGAAAIGLADRQRSVTPPAVAAPPPDMHGPQGALVAPLDESQAAAAWDAERERFGGG